MQTIIIMTLAFAAGFTISRALRTSGFSPFVILVIAGLAGALIGFIIPQFTNAQTVNMTASVRWNNSNLHTTRHPTPLSFNETDTGYLADMADGSQIMYTWLLYGSLLRVDWEDAYFFTSVIARLIMQRI